MDPSVHHSFFTACSRGFKWPGRSIKPDIHTPYEVFCQFNVVVFEENNLSCKLRHLGNFKYSLYEVLAAAVVRMGFACIDKLNGPVGIIYDPGQPVKVPEQK